MMLLPQDAVSVQDTLMDTLIVTRGPGLGGYEGNLMVVLILAAMLVICIGAGLMVVKWATR